MLKISVPNYLKPLSKLFGVSNLFLVGGYVRDLIEGKIPENNYIDLTSNLSSENIVEILNANKIRNLVLSEKHKTVLAVFENFEAEITTFRGTDIRDTDTGDIASRLSSDLNLRDFTINAIAASIETGELIDPTNGIADIKSHIVKSVGDPNLRFKEDPLRLMRMVRFGTAAGRSIEKNTFESAIKNSNLIHTVSKERIRDEFEKILLSPYPDLGLRTLQEIKILEEIIPEVTMSIGFEQNEFHTDDVFKHTLEVVKQSSMDRIVRLAAFFHDLGKPATFSVGDDGRRHFYEHEVESEKICKSVMERLKFSNEDIQKVSKLVLLHMRPLNCGAPGARRLMRALDNDMDRWLLLKRADKPPIFSFDVVDTELENFTQLVESEKLRLNGKKPGALVITGDDLKSIGIKPGPGMGKVLKALEEIVLDNPEKNDREILLGIASSFVYE